MKKHLLLAFVGSLFFTANSFALPEAELQNTLHPFATDGCTDSPNGMFGADWTQCCVAHDFAYWQGGTSADKLNADRALKSCIGKTKHNWIADVYYAGVRMFGNSSPKSPYVWGYGWSHYRGYETLTSAEKAQVASLKPTSLADLKIVKDPRSNVVPYPTENQDYCLDEVTESLSKLGMNGHVKHILYSPNLPHAHAIVTVEGCTGQARYDLQSTERCKTPVLADHRPSFIAKATSTLACDQNEEGSPRETPRVASRRSSDSLDGEAAEFQGPIELTPPYSNGSSGEAR